MGLIALSVLLAVAGKWPDPWAQIGDLDVVVISRGEAVQPDEHLVADKYTVVDIGAPWCAPCHDAARTLKSYVSQHPDTAVRVISLDSPTYDDPAYELLGPRGTVPLFLVYDPDGDRLYKGGSVDRALDKIDRDRSR